MADALRSMHDGTEIDFVEPEANIKVPEANEEPCCEKYPSADRHPTASEMDPDDIFRDFQGNKCCESCGEVVEKKDKKDS